MALYKDRRTVHIEDTRTFLPTAAPGLTCFQAELQTAMQALTATEPGTRRRKARTQQPWYLLLGAPASGKTTLLDSLGRQLPPVLCPDGAWEAATLDYAWWFFGGTGILDTCGRYALATPFTDEHAEWLQVLKELQEARPSQPLHGILLSMAADAVSGARGEAWQSEAQALRQRLSEIEGALGIRVPVYVLVTRCDLIEGFVEFFSRLPEPTHSQVFGWLHTLPWSRRARQHRLHVPPSFADIGHMLLQRLEQLRTFILHEASGTDAPRQQLFCFPEEFRALFPGLQRSLETLCDPEAHELPVWLRGLFFCSAVQQGQPVSLLRQEWGFPDLPPPLSAGNEPYFLRDLLTVILPHDHHLAHAVPRARRHP